MRELRGKRLEKWIKVYLGILQRYEVPPHAYGYCRTCNTTHDYWKCGQTDYKCPSCDGPLEELSPMEVAEALIDCERDGCFEEEFLYNTPLRPVLKRGV